MGPTYYWSTTIRNTTRANLAIRSISGSSFTVSSRPWPIHNFLKNQFKPDSQGHIDTLTTVKLRQRQVAPRNIPDGQEWFVHGSFQLLETQILVQVQGTVDAVETTCADSITLACQIDRRFDSDSTYPNDWRSVVNSVIVQNTPTVYYSCGGYAKVTKFANDEGAMFVEYHLIYDEPTGWFNGANLLRSKLHATDRRRRAELSQQSPLVTVRPSVEIIRQPDGTFNLRGRLSRSLWLAAR